MVEAGSARIIGGSARARPRPARPGAILFRSSRISLFPVDDLLSDPTPPPRPGEPARWLGYPLVPVIPGYTELGPVGCGGQGTVYTAIQGSTRRRVAIKVLDPSWSTSKRHAARFDSEMELISRLNHPHIVSLYDSGRAEDGRPYITMELLDGRPLSQCLPDGRPGGPFATLRQALEMFLKVCGAVAHAHRRQVIHRDLKPANIIIDAAGEPKVVDFGIAIALDRPEDGARPTQTGEFLGSLAYASPEQAQGLPGEIDGRTDVYSLGAILYEMLTGCSPHQTDGPLTQVLRRIAEERVVPPRERQARPGSRLPRVDRDLELVVLRALAKDRDARYPTVEQLREDVQRFLDGRPVLARPDSRWYVVRKAMQRHKGLTAALATLFLVLALSSGVLAWQRNQARRAVNDKTLALNLAVSSFEPILDLGVDGTRELAGAGPLRWQITETAEERFRELHDSFPDERLPLYLLGQIADRKADLLVEVGRFVEARRAQEEAMAIHRELVAAEPEVARWQRALALNHVKLGDIEKAQNRPRQAWEAYRAAEAIHLELAGRLPEDLGILDDLFWSQVRLSELADELGRTAEAEQHAARLFPLAERAERLDPDQPSVVHLQFQANFFHALRAWRQERTAEARSWALSALPFAERMVELEPAKRHPRFLEFSCLNQIGQAADRLGDFVEAMPYIDQALAKADWLAEQEPQNLTYVTNRAHVYLVRCRSLIKQERWQDAEEALRKATAAAETAARDAPEGSPARKPLEEVGEVEAALGIRPRSVAAENS